ncbi:MAG: alpha/beta hydrolase [Acidobacteriota bacterium]
MSRPLSLLVSVLVPVLIPVLGPSAGPLGAAEEEPGGGLRTHRIGTDGGLSIALHHYVGDGPDRDPSRPAVLVLHGSTFPTRLAAGYRFADGTSFLGQLHGAGFDAWGLDFLGYGGSDRYPAMVEGRRRGEPLGRGREAVRQVLAASRHLEAEGHRRVSIVAHSWGTVVAGEFARRHPERVDRLVLFGALAPRDGAMEPVSEAFKDVTPAQQLARFSAQVPPGRGPVLEEPTLASWGPAYLESDPASGTRTPPSVRVPTGPTADLFATWSGHLPYDPAGVRAPTLLIQGQWDPVTTADDARLLLDLLTNAAPKRSVVIGGGTHLLHLEKERFQLYAEVIAFLRQSGGGAS